MTPNLEPPAGFEAIIHSNPFGAHIGPIYELITAGGFVRGFYLGEKHMNAGGVAHGGVLMTFADIILGQAVLRHIERSAVTVRMTADFIAPVKLGSWVEGTAAVTHGAKTLVFVSGEICVAGKPVMTAQGTFKPPFPR